MPEGLSEGDVLSYRGWRRRPALEPPADPHWVDAPELTFGINFSHGGLRHNGRLCRYEQYLYDEAGQNPNEKWHPETSERGVSRDAGRTCVDLAAAEAAPSAALLDRGARVRFCCALYQTGEHKK